MKHYSIQDTHRLPYRNAVITAKQLTGLTTPVRFVDSQGSVLGLELRTNADGFLTDGLGTPYSSGVFVEEDAIITATYPNGISSWVVMSSESIDTFNGVLYGKVILDPNEYSEDDLVVGKVHYKRIFSANQKGNSKLSLNDLADVPKLYSWTDDQQIEEIDFSLNGDFELLVGTQTKVIIIKAKSGTSPINSNKKIILRSSLTSDGDTRFGRNLSIFNLTEGRISLKNYGSNGWDIGGINARASVMLSETYPDALTNSEYGGLTYYRLANNGNLAGETFGYEVPYDNKLVIDDSLSDIVYITNFKGTALTTGLILDTSKLANGQNGGYARRLILCRKDGVNKSLQLFDNSGNLVHILKGNSSIELIVNRDNITPVSENSNIYEAIINSNNVTSIPSDINTVHIDCEFNISKEIELEFSANENKTVRCEFLNNTMPVWVQLSSLYSDGTKFYQGRICIPIGNSRVSILNNMGVVQVLNKSWNTTYESKILDGDLIRETKNGSWEIDVDPYRFQYPKPTYNDTEFLGGLSREKVYIVVPIEESDVIDVDVNITSTFVGDISSDWSGAKGINLYIVSEDGIVSDSFYGKNIPIINQARFELKVSRLNNEITIEQRV